MSKHDNRIHALACELFVENSDWRWGQAMFNAAHRLYPEAADALRGGLLDPFHNSNVADEFRQEVARRVMAAEAAKARGERGAA